LKKTQKISELIKQLLNRIIWFVVAVVLIVAACLFLFTKCAEVVNQAGIVRGGSQRAIKLELGGQSPDKVVTSVENILDGLENGSTELGLIKLPFPKYQKSVSEVQDYWSKSVKPAMTQYRTSKDATQLLEVSEQYFSLTNTMVDRAQHIVDVMALILYVVLAVFVVVVLLYVKKVTNVFSQRVSEPLKDLEVRFDRMAQGNLSEDISYDREDEIGAIYQHMNDVRMSLKSYVSDIDENLSNMAKGDLVAQTNTEYIGEYIPIQENINHIRGAFHDEIESIGQMAQQVAVSANEVSKVSQSLAEGAEAQTGYIQQLQEQIELTISQNEESDNRMSQVVEASAGAMKRVQESRTQMENVVAAMDTISTTSEQIKSILAALQGITNQTSLLSLNASIEAARAGELGKGFAVVAEEVRELADQSAESTKNIQDLIANSLSAIDNGKEVVRIAAESLSGITESTQQMNEIIGEVQQLSIARQEQLGQVQTYSKQVLDVVTDNSAVSEECAASSEELLEYSSSLEERVDKFTI